VVEAVPGDRERFRERGWSFGGVGGERRLLFTAGYLAPMVEVFWGWLSAPRQFLPWGLVVSRSVFAGYTVRGIGCCVWVRRGRE
ncbi:MAG: hypothetical protein ACK6D7_29695, partial [Acidobacteriota bacterium]